MIPLIVTLLLGCDFGTSADKTADTAEDDAPPDTDDGYSPDLDTGNGGGDTGFGDVDMDGVRNVEDNCPRVPNAGQEDADLDTVGDACDEDRDADTVPNHRDPFPDDPDRPGVASRDHVYQHGPSQLWRFYVPTQTLEFMANFTFDQHAGSVTDLAIDQHGVLYAITFSHLFVCHPETGACWWQASLPGSYNGLSFVPDDAGVEDVLVGIGGSTWTAFPDVPQSYTYTSWGSYDSGYTSAGDVFHIRGVGTFAAVNGGGSSGVSILEVSTHGSTERVIEVLEGAQVWGLAGYPDRIYAFQSTGEIVKLDMVDGNPTTVATGAGWWGAGVRTDVTLGP